MQALAALSFMTTRQLNDVNSSITNPTNQLKRDIRQPATVVKDLVNKSVREALANKPDPVADIAQEISRPVPQPVAPPQPTVQPATVVKPAPNIANISLEQYNSLLDGQKQILDILKSLSDSVLLLSDKLDTQNKINKKLEDTLKKPIKSITLNYDNENYSKQS